MNSFYKIDLHTHSILSHDGGITAKQYENNLKQKVLDCIAITDHNEISFALSLRKTLGDRIIVGEEILTLDGEVVGLFLTKKVQPGLSFAETVDTIHAQDGLVYIPHPFERLRKSIQELTLSQQIDKVDIIETFNARAYARSRAKLVEQYVHNNSIAATASSDAHDAGALGSSYALTSDIPSEKTLLKLLQKAEFVKRETPLISLFSPFINKIKKGILHG